jgi:hypothetical protein
VVLNEDDIVGLRPHCRKTICRRHREDEPLRLARGAARVVAPAALPSSMTIAVWLAMLARSRLPP